MEDATEAGLLCMLAQEGEGTTAVIYEEVSTLCSPTEMSYKLVSKFLV